MMRTILGRRANWVGTLGLSVTTALLPLLSAANMPMPAMVAIAFEDSEYQRSPASQEAEETAKAIQQLLELEKRLKAEEAAKKAAADAAKKGEPATVNPPQPNAARPNAATPNNAAPNLTEQQKLDLVRAELRGATQPAAAGETPAPVTPAPVAPAPAVPSDSSATTLPATSDAASMPGATSAPTSASLPAISSADFVGPPAWLKNPRPINKPQTGTTPAPESGSPATDQPATGTPPAVAVPNAQPVVPADGKTEWFNFAETAWEDVIKQFAKRFDKPLLNEQDLIIGGTLNYINPKRFTLEEAVDELNFLMQNQGYRFVETENYLEVIPLSEMPQRVPIDRTYRTRELYDEARPSLRRMDYAIVYYRVPEQSAQQLVDTFQDALPDSARISVLGDTNQIKLVGTVNDIDRFFALSKMVALDPLDPRSIRVFEIKTNAAEIERMVRQLMDLPQQQQFGAFRPQPPRARPGAPNPAGVNVPTAETTGPEILITADDRTNSLIVKATPIQMAQIEELIRKVDSKPDLGKFETVVVPIKFADATEVERVLTQIFQQEQGQTNPNWQQRRAVQNMQPRRPNQPNQPQQFVQPGQGAATPESIIAEGIFERAKKTIRIAADERTNALIVYANEEGQKRVKELLQIIDCEVPSNFKTFVIKNAEAARIHPVIDQIAQGLGSFNTRITRGRGGTRVVLDDSANALHVLADREDMTKIAGIIQQLDVQQPELVRHVVHLTKLKPSQVAPIVQQLLAQSAQSTPAFRGPSRRGGSGSGVSMVGEAQVIPLDEAGTLIVVCDKTDWAKVEETIAQWDAEAIDDQPVNASYEVTKGDPQAIAALVDAFYRNYEHPILGRSSVIVIAAGTTLLVQGVQPAQDEIAQLIARLDVEDLKKIEVLPLQHADATDVAEQAARLFMQGGGGGGRRPGRGGGGASAAGDEVVIDPEPATNSLIVKADATTLERIKSFVMGQDQRVAAMVPEQKFYSPKYAEPREVAEAISGLFGGGTSRGGRAGRGGASASRGALVTALATETQVIVEAPAEKHAQIADFIAKLDAPEGREIVTTLVKMPGAQVQSIANLMSTAFRERAKDRGASAQFSADPTTETILISCPQDLMPEVDKLIGEYRQQTSELAWQRIYYKLKFADVNETVQWLKPQIEASVTSVFGSNTARQVQVTPDPRTGRVLVYAPQVAAKEAQLLLNEYDVQVDKPVAEGATITEVIKLPGLQVGGLAQTLNQVFGGRPQRADKLRATFAADELTESLIYTIPRDWKPELDGFVKQFASEAEKVVPEQQIFVVKESDAGYIAQKINDVFVQQLRSRRGNAVAERIKISVDEKLNRILANAPKSVLPEIENFVALLDQPEVARKQVRIFELTQATNPWEVVNVLNERFTEAAPGRRNTVGTEIKFTALGNGSVVAVAPTDKMPEIETLVAELDKAFATADEPPTLIELTFADPGETANMINQLFGQGKSGGGNKISQRVQVTVANNTLVVRAPKAQLEQIKTVIDSIDREDDSKLEVRSFELKVMSAEQVANQVNFFLATLGQTTRRGQIKPFAFGEGTTNTLLVGAPAKYMAFIQSLIGGIESKEIPESKPQAYALTYVRADQLQANVEALLTAKVAESEAGRKVKTPVKVVADTVSNRMIVYAPDKYQALAGELMKMLDSEVDTGEVTRIIRLERGEATQLAQTLTAMASKGGPAGRGGMGAPLVQVTPDAGSNSIILKGLPKDVGDLTKHASDLEEASQIRPEIRTFNIEYASTTTIKDVLDGLFEGGGASSSKVPVTITEDDKESRLIVTAARRDMAQIEAIIKDFDQNPYGPDGKRKQPGGKQIYFVDIFKGDADDIAWDVEDLFPPPSEGGPDIDADWDGRYIKVVCRPGEFPQIEKAIREVESRAKVSNKIVTRKLPPEKMQQYMAYLQQRVENVNIETPTPDKPQESLIEVLRPEENKRKKEDAKRNSVGANERPRRRGGIGFNEPKPGAGAAILGAIQRGQAASRPIATSGAVSAQSIGPVMLAPGAASAMMAAPALVAATDLSVLLQAAASSQPAGAPGNAAPGPRREPAKIVVNPDGQVVISGTEDAVSELEDVLDVLEEDLSTGQVIRIFEFTYGDVNAAAEVLNIMFNDRQQIQIPPQMQQQQQQQRNREGGEGQDGQGGQGGRNQQGGMMDQIRNMVGGQPNQQGGRTGRAQQGGQRIKIATDAGHNYLIIKCDETDLPEIRTLLRELDIKPGDVDFRVFQLVNLDANETAENIKAVFGIDKAQQRRSGGGAGGPAAAGRGGQADLLQMLQQQAVSVPGVEGGAKIQSVEVVPNKITNSLLVSAPPEAMKAIENVIVELESLEGRQLVGIYQYELSLARVDDILPLLREIFEAAGGGAGRGAAASPAALGPVTISGDPRANKIIFTSQAKDFETVVAQIKTLDVAGGLAEAETQVLQWGDASAIAKTISEIFVQAGGGGRGAEGGGAATALRIAAEPSTNSITVWGSETKREEIFTKIAEFEENSKRAFRNISLVYADAEDLADKLGAIFGGGGAARRGPRGEGGAGGSANAVVIVGDSNSKGLLVKAPDAVFAQIEEVVRRWDQPNEQLKLRTFAVKHANAELLVEKVKGAFVEYMAMLPRNPNGKPPFDPFTAVADPRTNSITIVGSEEIFAFVGNLIATVDVPADDTQRKQFTIFRLDQADAAIVADAINVLAGGGSVGGGGGGQRGGRPGMPGMGGGGSGGPLLDVQAVPEPSLNAVMVYGRPQDIQTVDKEVIQQLDNLDLNEQFADIVVKEATASQVVNFVQQFFDEQAAGASQGQPGASLRRGPKLIPNDSSNLIIARGSKRQIAQVQDLVSRFDRKDLASNTIIVRKIPPGRDAATVAADVERLVNQAEEQDAQFNGRQPRPVVIGSDAFANAIIIGGHPSTFGMVQNVVDQLEKIGPTRQTTRIIQLTNLTAEDAQGMIERMQQNRSGGNSGRSGGGNRNNRGGGGGFDGGFGPFFRGGFPGGDFGGFRPIQAQPSGGDGNRRRNTGRNSGRRGAWRIERAPRGLMADPIDLLESPAYVPTVPSVAASPVSPMLVGFLLEEGGREAIEAARLRLAAARDPASFMEDVPRLVALADPPADAAANVDAPVQQPRRAFGADRAAPASAPANPADIAAGVAGELQGAVTAAPLGARQIIVTGDEADIAFIESILRLMENTVPKPTIEIFPLTNSKAAVVAEVVTKTMTDFIESGGGSGPEDRFSISAEARSNSLIVSASERNIEVLRDLISQIDDLTVDGQTDFKTITLDNAIASNVVAQLKPAIERLNAIRQVPTEAQPSVQALPSTNGVLVIGTPKDIEEITRLVGALDVKIEDKTAAAEFSRAEVVLIPLKNAIAEEVAKTLTDLIDEQQTLAREAASAEGGAGAKPFVRKLRLKLADGSELPELDLEKPIKIVAEKGTNSLLVFSSSKNLEPLKAIVGVFDTLPEGIDTGVRAFVLKYAKAESVATLLEDVFTSGKGALRRPGEGSGDSVDKGVLPPMPPALSARGLPYNVSVTHDVRSNTVVMIGQKDALLLAGGLIAEFDKPAAQLGQAARIIELKNVAATKLAEQLTDLLEKRAQALGEDGNEARDSAVVVPEDRSNLLVVFASQEMYDMIENLAQQLDSATSYTTIDTRLRALKFADSAKLQESLQEIFDKKKESEPGNEPKNTLHVLADPRTNSLVLTGTRDFLSEAEKLIAQFDVESSGSVEVAVIPVQLSSPTSIAKLVDELITKSRPADSAAGTPVYVAADPVSGNLLVAAAKEDLAQIRRWVDLLDKPREIGLKTAIIPLQRAKAEDLSEQINELFTGSGGEGETELAIAHDAMTNSIIAVGPPNLVSEVERMVVSLDTTDARGGAQVRFFRLEQADAESAADLLSAILEGRGGAVGGGTGGTGGGAQSEAAKQVMIIYERLNPGATTEMLRAMRDQIIITADTRTNQLAVTAPPDSMPLVESLVSAIDIPPRSDKIEVFPLRNSDAGQLAETLRELFDEAGGAGTGGGQGGGAGSAGDDQQRQLTFAGSSGGGIQDVSFSADVRTNSIIAAGTPGYLQLVRELVYQLDTQPIEERKTMVYSPRNIPAAELAASLRDYSEAEQARLESLGDEISAQRKQEREIVAIDNEEANRVIFAYSPRFESNVLDILRELDQPPPQVSIEVLIVEVTLGNDLELGIEFSGQDLAFTRAGPDDTTSFDVVGGTDVGAGGSGLGGFTFAITGAEFDFLFRALQTESRLQVLSRPQIVATDNQEATIEVVDDVPYVSGTGTTFGGQVQTQVARQDVGITLTVTPQINPDGFVRMEILQEVSDFTDSTVQVGPGVTAPVFFRRQLETTVTVRDSETIVLGGLITSRKTNSESKVPIIGDIPILGSAFRFQQDSQTQTELLVVLTPRVIRTVEDFREESIAQRDRTGDLPGEILTNPLLNRLRVPPEQLNPADQDGVFGSFQPEQRERRPYTREFPAEPLPENEQPTRTRTNETAAPPAPRKPTYDLPIPAGYRARTGG